MRDKIALEYISKVWNKYTNWISSDNRKERYISKFLTNERSVIMLKNQCYDLQKEVKWTENINNEYKRYDCRDLSLFRILIIKIKYIFYCFYYYQTGNHIDAEGCIIEWWKDV